MRSSSRNGLRVVCPPAPCQSAASSPRTGAFASLTLSPPRDPKPAAPRTRRKARRPRPVPASS
eukprot:4960442-Prymnesium_polylepis.2